MVIYPKLIRQPTLRMCVRLPNRFCSILSCASLDWQPRPTCLQIFKFPPVYIYVYTVHRITKILISLYNLFSIPFFFCFLLTLLPPQFLIVIAAIAVRLLVASFWFFCLLVARQQEEGTCTGSREWEGYY